MPSVLKAERLCAVSVDLDEIVCYTAIHGLTRAVPLTAAASQAVYRKALPRLVALFERLALPATFFVVGQDLQHEHVRSAVSELARAGHEIGNHSHDHFYDLTRRSRSEMREQVAKASAAITRASGVAPRGFRAPGYTITDTLYDVLSELGVSYDSSVFPCPAYYGLKAAAISGYRLLGRPSRSVVDHPRVLSAPADPYRIGRPYNRRGTGLLELPIGVTRDLTGRLPFIGTSVIMAGQSGARVLTASIVGRPLVNLELHGIDAADAEQDDLRALARVQPDLRKNAREKLATLEATLLQLRAAGYGFVTLDQAARIFS